MLHNIYILCINIYTVYCRVINCPQVARVMYGLNGVINPLARGMGPSLQQHAVIMITIRTGFRTVATLL